MSNWRNVAVMAVDTEAPKGIRSARDELAARAARLVADRTSLDEKVSGLQLLEYDPSLTTEAKICRDVRVVSWQCELQLRDAYAAWLDEYATALADLDQKAYQARSEIEEKILGQLSGIGYEIDGFYGQRIRGEMLALNAHVRQARERIQAIEAAGNHLRDSRLLNENQRAATKAELDRFTRQILSTVN